MPTLDPNPENTTYYSNKRRINKLIKKIQDHVQENPDAIKFVKIPNQKSGKRYVQYRGYYWPEEETIDIDYRYEIIPTLIHEYLHHFHEDWSESKVEKEERCIMAVIPKKHCISLIKLFADYIK